MGVSSSDMRRRILAGSFITKKSKESCEEATYTGLQPVDAHHARWYAYAATKIRPKTQCACTARYENRLTARRASGRVSWVVWVGGQAPQWVVCLAPHDALWKVGFGQDDRPERPEHFHKYGITLRRLFCSASVAKGGVVTFDVELVLQGRWNSVKRPQ